MSFGDCTMAIGVCLTTESLDSAFARLFPEKSGLYYDVSEKKASLRKLQFPYLNEFTTLNGSGISHERRFTGLLSWSEHLLSLPEDVGCLFRRRVLRGGR
jgi:hypothetical protein